MEVLTTLDAELKLQPNHPFANHLDIPAIEASPTPERALAAADRLRDLQPGLAHNVHMPSHIDVRVGHWHEAILANQKAVEADRRYRAIVGPPKDLIIVYAAHNDHMLAYAAMMTGQRTLALTHIRKMVAELPEDFLREYAMMAEGFVAMPYEVMIRFGLWDEVLAVPEHPYSPERFAWRPEDTPHATRIGRQTVSIPLSAKLTDADADDVIAAVRTVLAR